jgi:glucokinase
MKSKNIAIGIDLGGTSIKAGLVDRQGKILKRIIIDSNAEQGPDAVINQIKSGINRLLKSNKNTVIGIGIGAPGTVNSVKGIVEDPPNIPGWTKINIGAIVKKEFGIKTFVENDANAAAIGELIYGAGKKYNNFIMVTLGTGVGGGIIFNKKIFSGETGGAGEFGHVSIDSIGRQCKCGSLGCIEAYIGKNYLLQRVSALLTEDNDTILKKYIERNDGILTPMLIQEAAEKGDAFSKSVILDAGTKLGYALASVVNVLDISTILVGGGLAGFGKMLLDPVESTLKERVLKPFRNRIVVKPAKLKNDAGIKGASALVFYKS